VEWKITYKYEVYFRIKRIIRNMIGCVLRSDRFQSSKVVVSLGCQEFQSLEKSS
jgi:hypothetical protein